MQATFFHRSAWRHVAPGRVRPPAPLPDDPNRRRARAPFFRLVEVRSRLFGHALISNAFCVGGGPLATDEASLADILGPSGSGSAESSASTTSNFATRRRRGSNWLDRDDLYAGFEGRSRANEDDNLKQIPRKAARGRSQGARARADHEIDPSPEAFFDLYARTMRDHGTPALPRRFFDRSDVDVRRRLRDPDCARRRAADQQRAELFLPWPRASLLHRQPREARARGANDLMYWALMRRAVERGCTVFDFGRSKVGTGPYEFKRNWGFEPRPVTHLYRLLEAQHAPGRQPDEPAIRDADRGLAAAADCPWPTRSRRC